MQALPVAEVALASIGWRLGPPTRALDDSVPARGIPPDTHRHSVLWIDDDTRDDDVAIAILNAEGFDVACAASAASGIALARAHEYSAILLDLRLPDMPGLQALLHLKAANAAAPVVVLTGFGTFDSAVTATKLGAAAFKAKPLLADDLAALLREVIARGIRPAPTELPQRSEAEWLEGVCDALADCETTDAVRALILDVLLDARLTLRSFFGCAEACRLTCEPHSETSVRLLASNMRAAIQEASRSPLPKHPKLQAALQELEQSGRKQSQQLFADRTALSRAYLSRRMSAETDRAPSEWCRASVMRTAFRQLLQTVEQVAQIAFGAGYEHPTHGPTQFDHDFVKMFGLCPRELRRIWASLHPAI